MTASYYVGVVLGILIVIGLLFFIRFLIVGILVYSEDLLIALGGEVNREPIEKFFRILDNIIVRGRFYDPKQDM